MQSIAHWLLNFEMPMKKTAGFYGYIQRVPNPTRWQRWRLWAGQKLLK